MTDPGKENPEIEHVSKPAAPELPKLSPAEHSAYNRLAEHMDLFVSTIYRYPEFSLTQLPA